LQNGSKDIASVSTAFAANDIDLAMLSGLPQRTSNEGKLDRFSMNSVSDKSNDANRKAGQLIKVFWLTVALDKVLQKVYSELSDQLTRRGNAEPNHPRFAYKARAHRTVEFVSIMASGIISNFKPILDENGNINYSIFKSIRTHSFTMNKYLGENDDCIKKSHKYSEQNPNAHVYLELDEPLLRNQIIKLFERLKLKDDLTADKGFMAIAQGELSKFQGGICSKPHYGVAIWYFGYNAIKIIEEIAAKSLNIDEFSEIDEKFHGLMNENSEIPDLSRTVKQNRLQLYYLADHLIHFLNICDGDSERHNIGPLLDELTESELLIVLRQIRSELRSIRQALSEHNPSSEVCQKVVQGSKRIDLFLDEATKKAGSAIGFTLCVVLVGTAVSFLELSGIPVVDAAKRIRNLIR
jgi:hypothetical protein